MSEKTYRKVQSDDDYISASPAPSADAAIADFIINEAA